MASSYICVLLRFLRQVDNCWGHCLIK